jgi:hypothetical protein
MNKYHLCSDEYKSLHNIFYNGAYYTIHEIVEDEVLTDALKISLIKKNLYK